ncbi:polysaccharide lyase family 14 protein [Botryobasidium botryosum FD-172 SS1]|uniref:Polysaccharide lyase family 14 protein n=1 Tax=Botryobasidium botryosum (strain FD-172 SS1) TaxID=930990 RepID=A0A067MVG3_BOTB1|nr:polysaccharide lyase family 14 protein [Botryobasidium botryosum FD-172 SS1]
MPRGGADFYATPIPLEDARNVSLAYSVYFPDDFDFVRGGKLPGLYGGHTKCSGGDSALQCFSTRMMWRRGGAGELYLYAPKDKQTPAVCSTPPRSICAADYGLSIGRGSFTFARGNWTHLKQTVVLNTPGAQDGAFTLEVNGNKVMDIAGVYYRGVKSTTADKEVAPPGGGEDDDEGDEDGEGSDPDEDDGFEFFNEEGPLQAQKASPPPGATPLFASSSNTPAKDAVARTVTVTKATHTVFAAQPVATVTAAPAELRLAEPSEEPSASFTGLFFSTFFGGHEPEFATPMDQYTGFKDFLIEIND